MPPPIGVVNGPLMPIRYSRKTSTVSSGSHEPVASNAFWPASTSFHTIFLPCLAAAASITSCAAGQMSTPVPSPSTYGMMGSSGTDKVPSACIAIFSGMLPTLVARENGLQIRVRDRRRSCGRARGRVDRQRRGRDRLVVEPGLVERLLHELRLDDDLDAPVLSPALGRRVRRDEVLIAATRGEQARPADADRREVVGDRVGAERRQVEVRRELPARTDGNAVGVAVDVDRVV